MVARAASIALLLLLVVTGPASSAAAATPAVVPPGDFVVVSYAAGQTLAVTVTRPDGTLAGRIPGLPGGAAPRTVALSTDRTSVFESAQIGDGIPTIYRLDLASGAATTIANGAAPAVSPDGTRLAYLAVEDDPLIGRRRVTGLAILDLASGTTRLIPAPDGPDVFRGPTGPLNWSPDGQTVALFDGTRIRLVDVATATDLASQPGIPGDVPSHPIPKRVYPPDPTAGATIAPPPGLPSVPTITVSAPPLPAQLTATSATPVFLDANTVVVLYDCCIGYSHLVAFDLRTGKRSAFATLYGPSQSIVRIGAGRLLVVTAASYLDVVTRGHTGVISKHVLTATG